MRSQAPRGDRGSADDIVGHLQPARAQVVTSDSSGLGLIEDVVSNFSIAESSGQNNLAVIVRIGEGKGVVDDS
jgi:hypothetical protein